MAYGGITEKKIKSIKLKGNLLYYRWSFILFIVPIFYLISDNFINKKFFLTFLATCSIYNALVSIFIIKNSDKKRRLLGIFNFIDIAFVSIFSGMLGGIKSDIYLVLFFIICYAGINSDIYYTIKISVFAVILYSAVSIGFEYSHIKDFDYWNLVVRDFFIMLTAFGIMLIVAEVKMYHEMHKKEFRLARTDKLTGLPNRHYLEQKLNEEVLYADYSGNPLNVLIFDLDNFKRFNDTYGHLWGDKLLTLFAEIIMQCIRKEDIPIRYGGEEFLILIRDLDMDMAKRVGERIRSQLEKQRLYIGDDQDKKKVTVSCGVAQYPKHSRDIKDVMDMADKALYQAKKIGKNLVVGYGEIREVKEG